MFRPEENSTNNLFGICFTVSINVSPFRKPSGDYIFWVWISYNSKNGGYYQDHTVAVYDLLEKRYLDAMIQPRGNMDEQEACAQMVDRNPLDGSCLYIADRGFYGFNLLAHIVNQNQFFLIRIKDINSCNSSFKDIALPDDEEFLIPVEFVLSRSRKKQDQGPNTKILHSSRKFDFIQQGDTNSKYVLAFRLKICSGFPAR